MSNESAPGQPPELKNTSTEQVKQKIKDHVQSAEVGTTRGMAIRDFIDNDKAFYKWTLDSHDTLTTTRYALTDETIRQRKNGVKGYAEEFQSFEKLVLDLRQAFSTDGLLLERKGGGGFMVREDHQFFDSLLKTQ